MPPLTIIPLGHPLLNGSSDLPEGWARRAGTHCSQEAQNSLRHSAYTSHKDSKRAPGLRRGPICNSLPIWSCSVWGLPCPVHYCPGGALLPHLFTLTPACARAVYSLLRFPSGGLEPAIPDVIRHTALRSSDFPLSSCEDSDHPIWYPQFIV